MKQEIVLMDGVTLNRALVRMSHEIIEKNRDVGDVVLVGIKTRGKPMAERVRDNIKKIEGAELPTGSVDITLYRDDLTEIGESAAVTGAEIDFDIVNKNVVLLDDVLYTGRTVRAAIEALLRLGRPMTIQLAVVIDRGHRELPIRADYVGKNIPTSHTEEIQVMFEETDGKDCVILLGRDAN